MSGFSQAPSPFAKLSWMNIRTLLLLLRDLTYLGSDHVKRRYREIGSNFDETLRFCTDLGFASSSGRELRANKSLTAAGERELAEMVLDRALRLRTRYRRPLSEFLQRFRVAHEEVVYRPNRASRHLMSPERNFLMELGAVAYDAERDRYVLLDAHSHLLLTARDVAHLEDPAEVAMADSNRRQIGLAAEEAVLSYERERLGEQKARQIEHVALTNAAAGYDIKSVTALGSGKMKPRCIEVKAVSRHDWSFWWTKNEMECARMLGDWYFLYLVPVDADSGVVADDVWIIRNPAHSLLAAEGQWRTEVELLKCSFQHPEKRDRDSHERQLREGNA